jgi:hydrogenase maturation factor
MRTAGQGPGGFEKRDGFMKPGQDLVMAGFAGYEGTLEIARKKEEELKNWFSPFFLRCLKEKEAWSVEEWLEEKLREKDCPVTAYEYAREGGILAALWNFSGIYNAGVDVDLRRMPIRQITVELCERYELNPYRLLCRNCVLLAADRGGQLVRELTAAGIPAAVIGSVTKGIARQIRHGEETAGYLERPQPDELDKL